MIGIFDSGIGGLTVAREVLSAMPEYQILYLGDTARLPYGNRSQDLIYKFTVQAVDYLFKQDCQIVIIACNTASSEALRKLQQEWLPKNYPDRRVLGVIRPVVEKAAKESRFGRIGVIGTRGTIKSESYIKELKNQKQDVQVYQEACPLLVPIVEERMQKRRETKMLIRNYLRPLKNKKIDTLIMGCTHYPMLYKEIEDVIGKSTKVLDTAKIVAQSLKDYLKRHPEIEKKLTKGSNHKYLVTDLTDKFKENAQNWMGQKINLEEINLE